MPINTLGAGFFAVYLVVMLAIGWLASRNQNSSEDFLVAGRSIGLGVLIIGNVAAMIHGGAIVSHVGLAAQIGGVAVTTSLSYALGFAVVLMVYAKKLRKSGGMTLPDYLAYRFNSRTLRGWSAIVIAFTSVLYLVSQINVMGFVLQSLIGLPTFWGKFLGTFIFVAYVAMGGLRAVIWTNIAQFAVIWLALICLVPVINQATGGWSELLVSVEQQAPGWTSVQGTTWDWPFLLSWYVLVFVGYSTRMELVTKLFAARDIRVARWSIPATAFLMIGFLLFGGLYLGAAARVLVWDQIATPDQAFPMLVALLAGPWISAFVLTAVASATMSTTDSLLLMSGASISHDLIRKCVHEPFGIIRSESYYLRIIRHTTVIVGLLAFLLSLLNLGLIWQIVSYAFAVTAAAFFFPLIAGMLSKLTSAKAALLSSICGTAVTVVWTAFTITKADWAQVTHPVIPGILTSGVVLAVVQYFSVPGKTRPLDKMLRSQP